MLLLALSCGLLVTPSTHRLPTSREHRSTLIRAAEPPPPEVIEAEANATPNRKYRLAGAATVGALAVTQAGLGVCSLAGVEGLAELGDNVLLFGNPFLTLLVDVGLAGTAGLTWQQEQATREANVARIWEEVQRRRKGGAKSGENRSQKRARKKPGAAKPVGMAPVAAAPPASAPPAPPPPASPPPGSAFGGLAAKASSFFDEANAMGRASALELNAQLEERGVLPKLEADGGGEVGSGAAEPSGGDVEAAPPASPSDLAGGRPSAAKGKRKKGGKKKRK